MMVRQLSLPERLRPSTLREFVLPRSTIEQLQKMLDAKAPSNMLLWGPPGTGKTSLGNMFLKDRAFGCLRIDGTTQPRLGDNLTMIQTFASTVSFDGDRKILFVDDADHLSKKTQVSLRSVIDRHHENCRFIFAANNLNELDAALRSRLKDIAFGIGPSATSSGTMDRFRARLTERLLELGIVVDPERLKQIVSIYFPDLRRINIQIEFEFGTATGRK
jgi:putative ATPase